MEPDDPSALHCPPASFVVADGEKHDDFMRTLGDLDLAYECGSVPESPRGAGTCYQNDGGRDGGAFGVNGFPGHTESQTKADKDTEGLGMEPTDGRMTSSEANRDATYSKYTDVSSVRAVGKVTAQEVRERGVPEDKLDAALEAAQTIITDSTFEPFVRDSDDQIVGLDMDHGMLQPAEDEYGEPLVRLALEKRKEREQHNGVNARGSGSKAHGLTLPSKDREQTSVKNSMKRLKTAATDARDMTFGNGEHGDKERAAMLSSNGGGGGCVENGHAGMDEWLGPSCANDTQDAVMMSEDVADGYCVFVENAGAIYASSCDQYLMECNRVLRSVARSVGRVVANPLSAEQLKDLLSDAAPADVQKAARRSRTAEAAMDLLKRYLKMCEKDNGHDDEWTRGKSAEAIALEETSGGASPSASTSAAGAGDSVKLCDETEVGEAVGQCAVHPTVLEGFSAWLQQNTTTKPETWSTYGRLVNLTFSKVLSAMGKEGTVLGNGDIRGFVVDNREVVERTLAEDNRRFVQLCFGHFFAFLGVASRSATTTSGTTPITTAQEKTSTAARASRGKGDSISTRLTLLDPALEAQFLTYLMKAGRFKEATAKDYLQQVLSVVEHVVTKGEGERVDMLRMSCKEVAGYITAQAAAVRHFLSDKTTGKKKGSAWKHFVRFLGHQSGPSSTSTSVPDRAHAHTVPLPPRIISATLDEGFENYLMARDVVCATHVTGCVTSVNKVMAALMEHTPASDKPAAMLQKPEEASTFLKAHEEDLLGQMKGASSKMRRALLYFFDFIQADRTLRDRLDLGECDAEVKGGWTRALANRFLLWLLSSRPISAADLMCCREVVGRALAKVLQRAGVVVVLRDVEHARQLLEQHREAVDAELKALEDAGHTSSAEDLRTFVRFVGQRSFCDADLSTGRVLKPDEIPPSVLNAFTSTLSYDEFECQLAARQIRRVVSLMPPPGPPPRRQCTDERRISNYLREQSQACERVLEQLPCHVPTFELFKAFLRGKPLRGALDLEGGPTSELSVDVSIISAFLRWLVQKQGLALLAAENVVAAFDRLIGYVQSLDESLQPDEPLKADQLWLLLQAQKNTIKDLVHRAANDRFRTALKLYKKFHEGAPGGMDMMSDDMDGDDDRVQTPKAITVEPPTSASVITDLSPAALESLSNLPPGFLDDPCFRRVRGTMHAELLESLWGYIKENGNIRTEATLEQYVRLIAEDVVKVREETMDVLDEELPRFTYPLSNARELHEFIRAFPEEVHAKKKANVLSNSAWKYVLRFVGLLNDKNSKLAINVEANAAASATARAAMDVVQSSGQEDTPAEAVSDSHHHEQQHHHSHHKPLSLSMRKTFKKFIRRTDRTTSRETRQLYSDTICDMMAAVLRQAKQPSTTLKQPREVCLRALCLLEEFVAEHAAEMDRAATTRHEVECWSHLKAFVNAGAVAEKGKRRKTSAFGPSRDSEVEDGPGETSEEGEDGEGTGDRRRKKSNGTQQLDVVVDQAVAAVPASARPAEPVAAVPHVLDPVLASQFNEWLGATHGMVREAVHYSTLVKQLLRRVMTAVGASTTPLGLQEIPRFTLMHSAVITADLRASSARDQAVSMAWDLFHQFISVTMGRQGTRQLMPYAPPGRREFFNNNTRGAMPPSRVNASAPYEPRVNNRFQGPRMKYGRLEGRMGMAVRGFNGLSSFNCGRGGCGGDVYETTRRGLPSPPSAPAVVTPNNADPWFSGGDRNGREGFRPAHTGGETLGGFRHAPISPLPRTPPPVDLPWSVVHGVEKMSATSTEADRLGPSSSMTHPTTRPPTTPTATRFSSDRPGEAQSALVPAVQRAPALDGVDAVMPEPRHVSVFMREQVSVSEWQRQQEELRPVGAEVDAVNVDTYGMEVEAGEAEAWNGGMSHGPWRGRGYGTGGGMYRGRGGFMPRGRGGRYNNGGFRGRGSGRFGGRLKSWGGGGGRGFSGGFRGRGGAARGMERTW